MKMEIMKLYHTSSGKVENPVVDYGRKNADFAGGFYLSDSIDFSKKWASGRKPYINRYSFDITGLKVKRFEYGEEWFDYIFKNRSGYADALADYDVIIGPIANDTLYETYGIITSGLISSTDALKLLGIGNRYYQINVKSPKAISRLKWEGAQLLSPEELEKTREILKEENTQFGEAFSKALTGLESFEETDEV